MEKEQILEKSRMENRNKKEDEGENFIIGKWHTYGLNAASGIFLLMIMINAIFGEGYSYMSSATAMFCIFFSSDMFGKYKVERTTSLCTPKMYLYFAGAYFVFAIVYLIDFISIYIWF